MGKAELTLDGLVDQAGDRFERELESGDRPSLEAFLEGHDSQARMALLQELLTLEVEHRCAAGETPDLQAYLIRFPDEQTVVEKVFHVLTEIESRSMNDESTDHPDARDTRKKLEDNADQFVGQTIGRYEVRKHLGQGGMGVVLLAWHPVMERLVALKLLPEKAARNQTFMQRFRREVQTIARLSHQNIVVAYDADEAEGQHFLVMEFVDGRDLGVLVKADGPVSVAQAMDFIRQAATGLEYAHKKGVTHRDVKPSNLILSEDGVVKVLDLGLARLEGLNENEVVKTDITESGIIMGTVDFMSPEQALDAKQADPRADIYSLGCTLYFLLTGQAPFTGANSFDKLLAHREAPIPSLRTVRPEIPEALDQLFRKAVAKRIEDRFASMADLIIALNQIAFADEVSSRIASGSTTTDRQESTIKTFRSESEPLTDNSSETSIVGKSRRPWSLSRVVGWSAAVAAFSLVALSMLSRGKFPAREGPIEIEQPDLAGAAPSVVAQGDDRDTVPMEQTDSSDTSPSINTQVPPKLAQGLVPFVATKPSQNSLGNLGNSISQPRMPDERTNSLSMTFRRISVGEFLMGAEESDADATNEAGRNAERPQHRVRITKSFWIGVHEVTQSQFATIMETNPSQWISEADAVPQSARSQAAVVNKTYRNHPVDSVLWADANEFCERLSKKENRRYRLPTEAEWEYACRAGTTTRYPTGDDSTDVFKIANVASNPLNPKRPLPVGRLAPNAWGLFDMNGNVREWCSDWFGDYEDKAAVDPQGPTSGKNRVVRGGCYYYPAVSGRSTTRFGLEDGHARNRGFRIVMELGEIRSPESEPAPPTPAKQ